MDGVISVCIEHLVDVQRQRIAYLPVFSLGVLIGTQGWTKAWIATRTYQIAVGLSPLFMQK